MPIGIKVLEASQGIAATVSPRFDRAYLLSTSTTTANLNKPVLVASLAEMQGLFAGIPTGDVAAAKLFFANAPNGKLYFINCDDPAASADPVALTHFTNALAQVAKIVDLDLGILLCPYFSQLSSQGDRTTLYSAIEAFCQKTDWVFFFNGAIANDTPAEILVERALYTSQYGHSAIYYDWVIDTDTNKVGASAAAAAIAINKSAIEGAYVAPAGAGYPLAGVASLFQYIDNETDFETLRTANVNVIQSIAKIGFCMWGARTLSSDRKFRQINTRFAISIVSKQLSDTLTPILFEGSDPQGSVLREVIRLVTQIMQTAWIEGGLSGETSDLAYKIEERRQTVPDLSKIQIRVYARFVETLEMIEVTLINVDVVPT